MRLAAEIRPTIPPAVRRLRRDRVAGALARLAFVTMAAGLACMLGLCTFVVIAPWLHHD